MRLMSKQITLFANERKKLNELRGNNAFADSHGMAYAWYIWKWRITPWFKFDGEWDTYLKQIDESFFVFLLKAVTGKLNRLNIKTKEEN